MRTAMDTLSFAMMEVEHHFRIKRGGGMGCHHPSLSSNNASPCPQDKLEDVAWNKPDSKTLERLVWSVYDGVLSPGPTLKWTGPKSYNQVTRRLTSKVFRGLQVHCPTQTSAQFDEPPLARLRSIVFVTPPSGMPKKSEATEAMDMTPHKVDTAEEGAVGGEMEEDPNTHPMVWMRDCQNSYSDEMISFWPLLHPLTGGGGTATRRLAHHLLSTWQWSAATHTMSCPPVPSNMEIGQWLPLDKEGKKEDLWTEAYTCCLQRMAEASIGCSWETEGEGMVPQVSPLVRAFLTAMGRNVNLSSVKECWPVKNDLVPRQPMNLLQARITHCLDNVAMRSPSTVAWDMFTWPESNKSLWKEDCLPYSPGSMVDLSTQMPGVHLKLHDWEGNYQGVARVLKYEGHMLIYDPQTNGAGWVVMKGIPSSLTEVEVCSAGDLGNFYPAPCIAHKDAQTIQSPPEEITEDRGLARAEMPRRMVGDVEAHIDWDTDDAQDRSHTNLPSAGIGAI